MYIKTSENFVINTAAIISLVGMEHTYVAALVDGTRQALNETEFNNLVKIFNLQGNLLDLGEVSEHSDGLDKLINYRNTKHNAGHQIVKMIKEADDTIKSLEEAEKFQADLMSKQQAFNFDGKVN